MNSERYKAQISLPGIGENGQLALLRSKVLVVGAGGLGCPAITYLAAAGIGTIGIMDHDTVSMSNLPRQPLYNEGDMGKMKAVVATERLKVLNSQCNLIPFPEKLGVNNALDVFSGYDLVLDCTDDISSRYVINDACVILNKPFIYAGIHRFQGQLAVFNFRNGPTYRCLFPEKESDTATESCSDAGVIGTLPGILGTWQANEAIKLIAGMKEVLNGKILLVDLLTSDVRTLSIRRRENAEDVKLERNEVNELAVSELKDWLKSDRSTLQLIDVRDLHETPSVGPLTELHLPVSEIRENLSRLSRDKRIIFYCQSGARSRKVAVMLHQEYGLKNVWSLSGGIQAWLQENN